MNSKKRDVVEQDGLDNDEEEVEDLCAMRQIEKILCTTYERKNRGRVRRRRRLSILDLNSCGTHNPMCD
jgi:hypothetical protein